MFNLVALCLCGKNPFPRHQNSQGQSSPVKASKGQNYFFHNPNHRVRPPLSVPFGQGGAMLMNSKSEHRTSNAERPTSNGKGTIPKVAGGFAALVARAFQPAGSGDFPVASSETRDSKVPWTRRQECLRYVRRSQTAATAPP